MSSMFEENDKSVLIERVVSAEVPTRILERVVEVVKGTKVVVKRMENCGGAKLEGQE
ncbi:CBL-interacting kinase, partial [Trifolium pratense]